MCANDRKVSSEIKGIYYWVLKQKCCIRNAAFPNNASPSVVALAKTIAPNGIVLQILNPSISYLLLYYKRHFDA